MDDVIQPSHPLSHASLPALSLSLSLQFSYPEIFNNGTENLKIFLIQKHGTIPISLILSENKNVLLCNCFAFCNNWYVLPKRFTF